MALWYLPARATDLLEAYWLAQASDPTFKAARHALEGIRQKILQAQAALLPVVNITGNAGNNRATTAFPGVDPVDREMQSWAWTLRLTQPLLRAGSYYAYQQSGDFN